MKGQAEIPDLRLSRLNKLITTFQSPPTMALSNMFGSENAESSTIKWESQKGNRGMTPFVSPDAVSPRYSPPGVAAHSAQAAYWKEKSYYNEEFLNNLRKEGIESQYFTAVARLARDLKSMRYRSDRRKEYMFAQMIVNGSLSYVSLGGTELSVDYDLPSDNQVSLTANYYWNTGTSRNIVGDIWDGKEVIHNATDSTATIAIINSTVLRYMAEDTSIQNLLSKSSFGNGDLFTKGAGTFLGINPAVLGKLLDLTLLVYDSKFTVKQYITANVAASATSIYVGDAADFATGTATLYDVSAGTSEEVTISAINRDTGVITVAATTAAFTAGQDYIEQVNKFVSDDKFVMMAPTVDGNKIATYMAAPFGLARRWGLYTDREDQWDPEGTYIRTQNKGLPVLYHRDAVYQLTIKA